MIERVLLVQNRLGLHARAAAQLVQLMNRFESDATLSREGVSANAKSIMGVLTLAAACGTEVAVKVEGPDEAQAMQALEQLFANKFGEE